MLNFNAANPVEIFLTVLAFLVILSLVITIHEAAHAFSANFLGDPTARLSGRMSLNPIVHIDPLGTLVLPLLLLVFQGPIFGWAKPTPVNPINFQNPRRDSALVAFSGPLSNFALATIFSVIFRLFPDTGFFSQFLFTLVSINLLLGIFNLIPIPPLDGYKVLIGILPKELALRLAVLDSMGPIFLLFFILIFFSFLSPFIFSILRFLLLIFTGTS